MKFRCGCGTLITDGTDYLPYKGYLIADEDWFAVLNAIDEGIEHSGSTPAEKKGASMRVRKLLLETTSTIYQCPKCGELRVDRDAVRHDHFLPVDAASPNDLLRGRQDVRG
jgi:hypothetical protein